MTAEEWDLTSDDVKKFIFRRYEIQLILFPLCNPNFPILDFTGWGSLTESQKEILTRYYLAPVSLRRTIYSSEIDVENCVKVLKRLKADRVWIVTNMIQKVRLLMIDGEISVSNTQIMMIDALNLLESYSEGGAYNLKAWITNEVGTIYENDGMAQKPYYTITLRDNLMNIYNGIN